MSHSLDFGGTINDGGLMQGGINRGQRGQINDQGWDSALARDLGIRVVGLQPSASAGFGGRGFSVAANLRFSRCTMSARSERLITSATFPEGS